MRIVINMKEAYISHAQLPTTNLNRQIETRLKEADARFTSGRRRVVAALTSADGPVTAADLQANIGDLPLSSLYRSLSVLEDAGVVSPHFGQKGVTRYELAEWLQGHHHHLVCVECGAVDDVSLTPNQERVVHRVIEEISQESGFNPASHTLEIEGRCARCR
jgi:Fe2+ or Zn2+ uptake regulation protein